jgi:hypothetical protein
VLVAVEEELKPSFSNIFGIRECDDVSPDVTRQGAWLTLN